MLHLHSWTVGEMFSFIFLLLDAYEKDVLVLGIENTNFEFLSKNSFDQASVCVADFLTTTCAMSSYRMGQTSVQIRGPMHLSSCRSKTI